MRIGRLAANIGASLVVALVLPGNAQAAKTTVSVDLSTSVAAMPIVIAVGCLPPPSGLFGPGPDNYTYGQTSFTTGAAGNYVFEVTGLGAPSDPAILLYQGAGAFNPASPEVNLVGCVDAGGFANPVLFPRLVSPLGATAQYTVVVILPKDPGVTSGTVNADLGLGLVPTITYANKSVTLGAAGQSMTATSNSVGLISYTIQNPAVATIDVASGAITTVGTGTTQVAAIQDAEAAAGIYGSGVQEATLTVTSPSPTSQTITFNNPGAQTFGTTPTITATASSGLAVAFSSSTTGVCTITTGGTLTFVTAGTCTINADQAGNGTYAAAPTLTQSFTVNPLVPSVVSPTSGSITANSATLGGNVTSDGGGAITERGVVYSFTATNPDPLIGGTGVTKATGTGTTGVFTVGVTGLAAGSGYSFKAYAANSAGAGYTAASTLTTSPPDYCAANPCQNGGICTSGATTYTCTCNAGYSGTNCQNALPAKLGFTTPPGGAVAGIAFTTQPSVAIQDGNGNTVTTATDTVSLQIKAGTGTAGAALACPANPVSAVSGVATFAGCRIDRAGTGYVLTAGATGLTSADSAAFAVASPPPVSGVNFSVNPAIAGAAAAMTVTLTLPTALAVGDTITAKIAGYALPAGAVSVSIGTPSGAVLSGNVNAGSLDTLVATAGSSIAAGTVTFTFPVTNPAAGTFAKAGLTVQTSQHTTPVASASDIVIAAFGTAAKLAFVVQPGGAVAGAVFTTQPQVAIQDALGNTVTSATNTVTLASSISGALSCTANSVAAAAGVATFAGCKINTAGTHVLTASSTGLTSASSSSLVVTPPPAITGVSFSVTPATASSAATMTVQFTLPTALAAGDTITATASGYTFAAGAMSVSVVAPAGAVLTGSVSAGALNRMVAIAGSSIAAGAVTFSFPVINPAAGTVAKAGLTVSTSQHPTAVASANDLVITAAGGTATKLAFITQPSGAVAGVPFTTQPRVAIQDAAGNTVTSATNTVTLASSISGALSCTANSVAAAAGVATFAGCKLNPAGTHVLTASSTGLTSASSNSIVVTSAPAITGVSFSVAPATASSAATMTVQLTLPTALAAGDTITATASGYIFPAGAMSVSVVAPAGAVLTGNVSAGALNTMVATAGSAIAAGTVTFSFPVTNPAAGTLAKAALTVSTSQHPTAVASANDLVITAAGGTATKLVITAPPPASVAAGDRFNIVVTAQDAAGTIATGATGAVTIATQSAADAGKLKGFLTASLVAGVASFTGLHLDQASSTGYVLVASAAGLTSAQSPRVIVTAPTRAAYIAFSSAPAFEVTGVAFSTQPVVKAFALDGTVFTPMQGTVTLSAGPAAGTSTTPSLTGTTTVAFVAGVATFSGLRVTAPAGNYALTATSGALTASTTLSIYADAATASTARATEQTRSTSLVFNLQVYDSVLVSDVARALKADLCLAAGLDATSCARLSVSVVRSLSSSSATKATCPAVVSGLGVVTVPPCMYEAPGIYRLLGTSPGIADRMSNPFTVVDTLTGNLPGSPRNLRVDVSDGQAVVSWDPPVTTGAGRIVAYEVFGLRAGLADQSLAKGLLTSKTLKLANGTEWSFGVRAFNALGGGNMATSALVRIGPKAAVKSVSVASAPATLSSERIDGQCGAAANRVSVLAPTEALCEAGSVRDGILARRGAWAWTCAGAHGGSAASCSTEVTASVAGLGTSLDVPHAETGVAKLAVGGCTLQRAETVAVAPDAGPGTGAVMLYGATGLEMKDCRGGLASVTLGYPTVVQGMQLYTLVDGLWHMVPLASPGLAITGDTATFAVVDNGPMDADPQVGVISVVAGIGYLTELLPALPAAPVGVTATAGTGSVTVSWTTPASGGAPVRYIVVASPGGASCMVDAPATSCTVTGLTAGVVYTFTVVAENATGVGAASAPSAAAAAGGLGPVPVPTLSEYSLVLLVLMLMLGAWRGRDRLNARR